MKRLVLLSAMAVACDAAPVDIPFDSDGDGMMDDDEVAAGTDPENADSDDDGWEDGEEVASYTDPADPDDHPYTGGWKIDSCRHDVEPTGNAVGDIAYDFELEDQFGDTLHLHDFCGQAVFIESSAFW